LKRVTLSGQKANKTCRADQSQRSVISLP